MHTCKNQVTTPIAGTVRSPDVKTQGFINSYDPRPYFTWLDRDPRHRPRKKTARRDVVSRDASSYLKLLTACATSCTLLREKSLCTIIYRNFTIKYKKKKKIHYIDHSSRYYPSGSSLLWSCLETISGHNIGHESFHIAWTKRCFCNRLLHSTIQTFRSA